MGEARKREARSLSGREELAQVFGLLRRATLDRRSPWRNVQLATLRPDGAPSVRTLVLRNVDEDRWRFDLWTDARSSKAREIGRDARAELLCWDGKYRQLRVGGRAELHSSNEQDVGSLLASLPDHALTDYASVTAPGSPDPQGTVDDRRAMARAHFRRLRIEGERIDLLALSREGHRRWIFERDGEEVHEMEVQA